MKPIRGAPVVSGVPSLAPLIFPLGRTVGGGNLGSPTLSVFVTPHPFDIPTTHSISIL